MNPSSEIAARITGRYLDSVSDIELNYMTEIIDQARK